MDKMHDKKATIEELAMFCKKKGFVYQSAGIYGGFSGFFDYGPLGVELKENIKHEFWKRFVQQREDIIGIDGSIITNPIVWQASGHTNSFTDVLLECRKCGTKANADTYIEERYKINLSGNKEELDKILHEKKIVCQKCNSEFITTHYNLMLKTNVGPIESSTNVSYLRPETAQLIFINFKQVQEASRKKLPFGIAQIGKAFRNEISPRDFLFRAREFEQMEIEFFVHPNKLNECKFFEDIADTRVNILTANMQESNEHHKQISMKEIVAKKLLSKWHAYWLCLFYRWFLGLGINPVNIRLREHKKEELAHYACACFDIEYNFPFGWKEIHGNADRGQFDLNQHIKFSKRDLSYFDEDSKTRLIPYVASEPSQGVDRAFLAFLYDAYSYDKVRENTILRLHPKLAPIKVGVFPLLSNNKELVERAKEIYSILQKEFNCFFDASGSIGRRYARMDEIGTPLCITIDFDTLKDNTVTVRNRDTMKQERIGVGNLVKYVETIL